MSQEVKVYARSLRVVCIGTVVLHCKSEDKPGKIGFKNILHVPDASLNLLSFGQLHGKCWVTLTPEGFNAGAVGTIPRERRKDFYTLSIWEESPISFVNTSSSDEDIMDICHTRGQIAMRDTGTRWYKQPTTYAPKLPLHQNWLHPTSFAREFHLAFSTSGL